MVTFLAPVSRTRPVSLAVRAGRGVEQWDHRYNRRTQPFDALEFQAVKSDRELAELRARLLVLDRERQELQKRLAELTSAPSSCRGLRSSEQIAGGAGQVVNASPVLAKVALFRRLFAGLAMFILYAGRTLPRRRLGMPRHVRTSGAGVSARSRR